ncbi:lysozyme inhibitor LprI family protein [Bacillus sp. JJ1533]|uniref:lysozyme inhibitor LprI family protein n=1 Tax=Bacillus sp. JJ1533 TaxID=3122959 RepID=UPI002FFE030D
MNRKSLIAILTMVSVILLAACQNSSEDSSAKLDKPSQNKQTSQSNNDDSSNVGSTENTSNADNTEKVTIDTSKNETNEKTITSNNVPKKEETSSTNATESLKVEYLQRLNDTKKMMDEMEATDTSTYALKKVEDDRWDIWDELLNEIYGVLNEQLPTEKMDQLRQEQRNWIKFRDDTALEASHKFNGGTQEHLEYSAVSANLTEERCYELVEYYM